MKFAPYNQLKALSLERQSFTIGILAWLGIVATWGGLSGSIGVGLLLGLHFFLPLTFAMIFCHNVWIKPTFKKLQNKEDWPRRTSAAVSYGILFAFLTAILMCVIYVGEAHLMQFFTNEIHPERLAEIQTAKETVGLSYILCVMGPLYGVWAWFPLGILQGYLLLAEPK